MKRLCAFIFSVIFMFTDINYMAKAETYVPSRTINVVYDDSGSMIRTDGVYVDTWCQAKYAMEVFAAMLGENDTLNVYYMSDYVHSMSAPAKLSLKGSKDASTTTQNVNAIHNLVTDCSDTPFNAVKKAYEDLKGAAADEKWLVALTDGEFNNTKNQAVENYFNSFAEESGINIMMLSMGPNAAVITPNSEKRIYCERAKTTTDIPIKLTEICNRIFQRNALPFDTQKMDTSFNVPMSQLIVFAQGKNVLIGDIKDSGGNSVKANSDVKVSYSTVATTDKNYPQDKSVVADNLLGHVATYDCDFMPGKYSFDISGADSVQIYYKPNVSIKAYLYNGDKEVTAEENLVSGDYRLEFGFINASNGEKISDTSLLGNIEYQANISNTAFDGTENNFSVRQGDNIKIKEGTLVVDVTARFLDYNAVNTKLSYSVYSKNGLIFSLREQPQYTLTVNGLSESDKPMTLQVEINDENGTRPLSNEQWELMGLPDISTKSKMGDFRIEKSDEIGIFFVYPGLKDGDAMKTSSGIIPITISGSFTQGLSTAVGENEESFEIKCNITLMERIKDWLKKYWLKLLFSMLILLLLLGYIPGVKKYLPRKIKKRPWIECSAEKIGIRDTEAHGKYKRNIISTIIPYKAETGFITFSPSPYKKTAHLRAAGGHGAYITNVKSYAGKDEFMFNGMSIEEGRTKPYRISGGSTISLRTPEYLYTCYLNR